jgi:energy-coupling factor transporter ATP-binding protein EcfA2
MSNKYLSSIYKTDIKCVFCKKQTCIYHKTTNYHNDGVIIACVKDIIIDFKKLNEQLLIAQTQCGKSDIIKRIIDIFNNNKELFDEKYNIQNIFIIICAADNDLKDDHKNEFYNFIDIDHVLHLPDLARLTNKLGNQKQSKLYKQQNDQQILDKIAENCLIIFDESHCDLQDESTIDQFRKALKISFNNYTNKTIKILNISATGYDQMKVNIKTHFMSPRPGYYGIIDMYKSKKLQCSFDLLKENQFEKFMKNIMKNNDLKSIPEGYYIIRMNDNKEQTKLTKYIKTYFKNKPFEIKSYNMKTEYDINIDCLDIEPEKPTFIIIMNRLRKGKKINKKYIIAVHDKSNNTLTHTTYQGLLGRMTGYNANKSSLIYCDINKAIEHIDWIKNNYSKENIPVHMQWIKKDGSIRDSCMLYSEELSIIETDTHYTYTKEVKSSTKITKSIKKNK